MDDHKPFSLGNRRRLRVMVDSFDLEVAGVLLLARPLAKIDGIWMGYEWDIILDMSILRILASPIHESWNDDIMGS